jgi:hypothetical protein
VSLTPRLWGLALRCAQQELDARAQGKAPGGVQPWNAELIRALELELAVSRSGHRDLGAEQDWDPQEWLTAAEAAGELGMSKRQVTRIANGLGGRIIGGRWLFPTSTVREHREGRQDGNATA